jgi:hypothetical protein
VTHDVFICHSSKDRTIANAICSKLEQNGIRCWIAPRDVLPGSDFAQSIIEAISSTKLTVLVFSSNSNESPHVHREIERTVGHGIPILPFRVDEVIPSLSLEYFISNAHWLDAITPPLEQHLQHLVGTVRLLLDRAAVPPPEEEGSAPAPQVAPGSGSPGPGPPVARAALPAWWRWAALAAVVVLVAVTAGILLVGSRRGGAVAGSTQPPGAAMSSAPAGSASGPTSSSSASTTRSGAARTAAKLGEPITLTGLDTGSRAAVTALEIVDPTTATDSISAPAAGNRYVAIRFQIENTGTVLYDDSPDNSAELVDATGRQFPATTLLSVAAGPLFPSTITVHPGEKALGYVVFEVPVGSRITGVHFALDSGYADDWGLWPVTS